MNQLGTLGLQIWDIEFGDHTSEEDRSNKAVLISGYLDANLGQLNTLIHTDFKVDSSTNEISPPLKYEEKAIFTQLYLKDYLKKEARNTLKNAINVSGSASWMELREGDSSIKRAISTPTSKNASAQILQKAASEANETLKELVHAYNVYGAIPTQVAGLDGGKIEESE